MGRPPHEVCHTVSRFHIPLMCFVSWLLFFCLLTALQSCSSQLSTPDEAKEQWIYLVESCTAEEARHSFLCSYSYSPERNHRWRRAPWAVPPQGRGNTHKVKLFLLPSPVLRFPCSIGVLELLHWTPGLSKGSLPYGWLSKPVFSRGTRGTILLHRPL